VARGRLLLQVERRVRLIRVRRFLLWGGLLVVVWALVGGQHGAIRYQLLKHNEAELVGETRQLSAQIVDLKHEIWRLQNDTLYIEKVARERLGYARSDDRVFKITPY
jgi:cell division protein FtsB